MRTLTTELVTDPYISDRLEEEAFAGLLDDAGPAGADGGTGDDGTEYDDTGAVCPAGYARRVLATAIARDEATGGLFAWAELVVHGTDHEIQWTPAAREAELLRGGNPPSADEEEYAAVLALTGDLVAFARAAGVPGVSWTDDHGDIAGRLAAAYGATRSPYSTCWSADLAHALPGRVRPGTHTHPAARPLTRERLTAYTDLFHADAELGDGRWQPTAVEDWLDGRVVVELLDGQGALSALLAADILSEEEAGLPKVVHAGVDPEHLAGAFVRLAEEIRAAHPTVTTLFVIERNDRAVAGAATLAAFTDTHHSYRYELALS
ncbi:hypothetical protein [Streptomyces sp. NPDC050856]|uniref:hypothetical protein n=1 Tax=Streptomyces sp. NPDC050856 TaxID=3154939 RepID=UPI0033DC8737